MNPDICCRCAHGGPTCCHHSPGEERFFFPLPQAEQAALRASGLVREEDFLAEPNHPEFLQALERLFPGAPVTRCFPEGATHLRLATQNGACVLLSPQGCRLPRHLRPYFCRIYPLWSIQGRLALFHNPRCLAYQKSPHPQGMLKLMGCSADTIHDHVATLRQLLFEV